MKSSLFNFILINIVTLLLSVNSTAQAPNLGSALEYVLFTSTGAVGNTGISHITGNVGTNSGAITGFGNVNGTMNSSNGSTMACAGDVLQAYGELNVAIPDFFIAPLIGNNDTLDPGVYSISGNSVLSNVLKLDGLGNQNAVFIFQIQGTFSSSSNAQVELINGAQACNVFWKVEGLVSLASSTSMKGTIIANNAAIDMSAGVQLDGRALSTAGAINLNGIRADIPNGCNSPQLSGPSAPPLGTTTCYGLFTSNGEMTNAGITFVAGDVGTNVGVTTGFDPLNVTGTIHPIPDNSTVACAADLLVAYNFLNSLPHDIELLYPADFGNGLILTPHTYLMNAATALTGNVTFNAMGNSNAIFVIKVFGAFSTSTYASVSLINGAQSQNIYWVIEGAISINDYSLFRGTLIANNGAVNLATGVELIGSAYTTNGAFTTASINNTNMNIPCETSLPLKLLNFSGILDDNQIVLKWVTTQEINVDYTTVEKSTDGYKFTALAKVNATNNSSNFENTYVYLDPNVKIKNYYRLLSVDFDGQYQRSEIILVNGKRGQQFSHTVGDIIQIFVSGPLLYQSVVSIYAIDGQRMNSQIIEANHEGTVQIINHLSKGLYLLNIEQNGEAVYKSKFLVVD